MVLGLIIHVPKFNTVHSTVIADVITSSTFPALKTSYCCGASVVCVDIITELEGIIHSF